MRDLLVRTATGVVFVALVLAAMLGGRVSYAVLLVFVAAGCMREFYRLAQTPPQKWLGILCIALCLLAMWFFPVIGVSMTGLPPGRWDARIAPAFAITVWANDTFAYLVGITLGRHKMSERLSPKKSWEGFAGGIAGAVAVAAILGRFWFGAGRTGNAGGVWLWVGFGLAVALAAVVGDLVESHFKRLAGVKDSGRLFPGHGGFLDRFDAMLGAVPAAFVFFIVTLLCGGKF